MSDTGIKDFYWVKKLAPYQVIYRCSDDCKQSGCPTHTAEFRLNSVVDMFEIKFHDKTILLDSIQMSLILDFAERLSGSDIWPGAGG